MKNPFRKKAAVEFPVAIDLKKFTKIVQSLPNYKPIHKLFLNRDLQAMREFILSYFDLALVRQKANGDRGYDPVRTMDYKAAVNRYDAVRFLDANAYNFLVDDVNENLKIELGKFEKCSQTMQERWTKAERGVYVGERTTWMAPGEVSESDDQKLLRFISPAGEFATPEMSTLYADCFQSLKRENGSFPLGRDLTLLRQVWRKVFDGGNYSLRPPTSGPYCCSPLGRVLMDEQLNKLSTKTNWPAAGSDGWYDWAIFVFGAIMFLQPFADANKRMARIAYALMLTTGKVPFIAVAPRYGGELAAMGGEERMKVTKFKITKTKDWTHLL